MEGADEGGAVAPVPRGDLATEVLGQTDRVAEQGDALGLATVPASRQLLGLLERQHGLPAAGPSPHLDAVEQSRDMQDRGLLHGEPVELGSPVVRLRVDVVGRGKPAGQDVGDDLDVVVGR